MKLKNQLLFVSPSVLSLAGNCKKDKLSPTARRCNKKIQSGIALLTMQEREKTDSHIINGKTWLRYAITVIITQVLLFFASAQVKKKDFAINFGASSGYGYPSELTSTENSGIPTLNLHAEYSLNSFFSLGSYVAYTYSFFKFDDPQQAFFKVDWKGWDIGLRNTLHFGSFFLKDKKSDLYLTGFSGYTALALVYDKTNIYRDSLNYKVHAFTGGGILGLHFFINNKFGFYGETGFSRKFFIAAGLTYKIGKEKNKESI